MKNIVLLMIALLTSGILRAQHKGLEIEPISHEQALKSIEEQKFVFRANLYEDKGHQYNVDSKRNFIIMYGNKVTIQVYESPQNSWAMEGKTSNLKGSTDKLGNSVFEMSVKNKGNSLKLKLSIDKDNNRCIVKAIPVNFHTGFIMIGKLLEYDVSDLVRTNILQIFQVE